MLSSDVRHALARAVAAAGLAPADPRLRPTGTPGQYASGIAFALGEPARPAAERLAALLAAGGIGRAEVTGPGFITITVPPAALAALPGRIIAAGPACARSDALAGLTVPAPPPSDPLTAPGWEQAAAALAARLTARLAAAAGATVAPGEDEDEATARLAAATVALSDDEERAGPTPPGDRFAVGGEDTVRSSELGPGPDAAGHRPGTGAAGQRPGPGAAGQRPGPGAAGQRPGTGAAGQRPGPDAAGQRRETEVAAAVAFAGADAVLFSLARVVPGRPVVIDRRIIARHVTDNPAYAVRYAHARAASELRWAAGYRAMAGPGGQAVPRHSPASQGELLVDALSWLPERVAAAGRRGRPDEFARYLEELAGATIAALIGAGNPGSGQAPGTDRLGLAGAARTGLAAGLGLLGISAPDRL